jgi:hypothetical protein
MTVSPDQTSYMQSAGHGPTSGADYTAVVYFHGIGSQRHYEEVSSLLQQFDQLIYKNQFPGNPRSLQKCIIEVEQGRVNSGLDSKAVTYHKVIQPLTPGSNQPATVRFYEAYWAAETVGGTNTLSVIAWVLKQAAKPIMVLKAHWGEIGSLRIGTLYGQYENELARIRKAGLDEAVLTERVQTIKSLIASYREFVQPEKRYDKQRPAMKRGETFRDYKEFLQEPSCVSRYGTDTLNLIQAAGKWWRQDIFAQLSYFLIIMVLLLLLLGAIFSSLWLIYAVMVSLIQTFWPEIQPLVPTFGQSDMMRSAEGGLTKNHVLILVLLPLTVIVGTRLKQFLSDYLGDVQQYVTFEETDVKYERRTKILNRTVSMLRHVLLDEHCTRVIVIAHSLGSVIAYDSLLELERYNLALKADPNQQTAISARELDRSATRKPEQLRLEKIQHFVTMGSPIDKTQYFFATLRSRVSRYVETIEAIRGNISTPPFTIAKEGAEDQGWLPQIHWVNYWDQADLISGPIWNVIGADIDIQRVDNVRVASYSFPEPARSHAGYFFHIHVLEDLYEMIFKNRFSFVQAREQGRNPEWVAGTDPYTKDAGAYRLFPRQKAIQLGVLIVMLVIFDYTVLTIYGSTIGLLFSPLIELIMVNLFNSPQQPWVLLPALLVAVALALILSLLRQWLKPRASISVTVPPSPAEPEQAHI